MATAAVKEEAVRAEVVVEESAGDGKAASTSLPVFSARRQAESVGVDDDGDGPLPSRRRSGMLSWLRGRRSERRGIIFEVRANSSKFVRVFF